MTYLLLVVWRLLGGCFLQSVNRLLQPFGEHEVTQSSEQSSLQRCFLWVYHGGLFPIDRLAVWALGEKIMVRLSRFNCVEVALHFGFLLAARAGCLLMLAFPKQPFKEMKSSLGLLKPNEEVGRPAPSHVKR